MNLLNIILAVELFSSSPKTITAPEIVDLPIVSKKDMGKYGMGLLDFNNNQKIDAKQDVVYFSYSFRNDKGYDTWFLHSISKYENKQLTIGIYPAMIMYDMDYDGLPDGFEPVSKKIGHLKWKIFSDGVKQYNKEIEEENVFNEWIERRDK